MVSCLGLSPSTVDATLRREDCKYSFHLPLTIRSLSFALTKIALSNKSRSNNLVRFMAFVGFVHRTSSGFMDRDLNHCVELLPCLTTTTHASTRKVELACSRHIPGTALCLGKHAHLHPVACRTRDSPSAFPCSLPG